MTNKVTMIGMVLVLTAGFTQVASAASMRCGTHIISSGQNNSPGQYEVLKRCGEPDARQGDTWIYERSSSVTKQIRFDRNGRILEIR